VLCTKRLALKVIWLKVEIMCGEMLLFELFSDLVHLKQNSSYKTRHQNESVPGRFFFLFSTNSGSSWK